MNTCRSSLLIALVLGLVLALAVAGSDPAAAKKKEEWVWTVEILEGNLLGGQQFYTDGGAGDGVWADVTASRRGRGYLNSWFGVAVFKCESDEPCDGPQQPNPVKLQGIVLDEDPLLPREDDPGDPCVFPGICGEEVPDCMECFLNGEHPYWSDSEPSEDYRYFSFEVTVPGDFEDIEPGPAGKVTTKGNLYINLFNTDEQLLPPGDGHYHNIDGRVALAEDAISITRTGNDTWTVHVTVNSEVTPMLFSEWYVGCAKRLNPKKKCPWEYKYPIDSLTAARDEVGNLLDPLSFEVTWTRIAQ